MNEAARKTIRDLEDRINAVRAALSPHVDELELIRDELTTLAEAEQEKFDNLSEGLQGADNGQAIESSAIALQEAVDSVDEHHNALESLVSELEELVAKTDEAKGSN